MKRECIDIDGKIISCTQNQENGIPVFLLHGNSAGLDVFLNKLIVPCLVNNA